MKTACDFEQDGDSWRCRACGRKVKSEASPIAVCRGQRGLGDMVADGLARVGVTKERAQAVANAVGIKDCGCKQRQDAMNSWGAKYLGIGAAPAAQSKTSP